MSTDFGHYYFGAIYKFDIGAKTQEMRTWCKFRI